MDPHRPDIRESMVGHLFRITTPGPDLDRQVYVTAVDRWPGYIVGLLDGPGGNEEAHLPIADISPYAIPPHGQGGQGGQGAIVTNGNNWMSTSHGMTMTTVSGATATIVPPIGGMPISPVQMPQANIPPMTPGPISSIATFFACRIERHGVAGQAWQKRVHLGTPWFFGKDGQGIIGKLSTPSPISCDVRISCGYPGSVPAHTIGDMHFSPNSQEGTMLLHNPSWQGYLVEAAQDIIFSRTPFGESVADGFEISLPVFPISRNP